MNKKERAFGLCDAVLMMVVGFSFGIRLHGVSVATLGRIQAWLAFSMVVLIIATVVLWLRTADVHENGRSK